MYAEGGLPTTKTGVDGSVDLWTKRASPLEYLLLFRRLISKPFLEERPRHPGSDSPDAHRACVAGLKCKKRRRSRRAPSPRTITNMAIATSVSSIAWRTAKWQAHHGRRPNLEQNRTTATTTIGADLIDSWTREVLNLIMDRMEQKGSPLPGMVPSGVSMTRLSDEVYTVNIRFHKEAKP